MKLGHGIFKGKAFEREAAKLLTKLTGKEWKRVPCSGGFATAQGVQDSRFKGDLFCEEIEYKDIMVECKIQGKAITIQNMTDIVERWWKQAVEEAGDETPILIFTFSGSKKAWLVYKADMNNPLGFISTEAFRGCFGKYELKVLAMDRKSKALKEVEQP